MPPYRFFSGSRREWERAERSRAQRRTSKSARSYATFVRTPSNLPAPNQPALPNGYRLHLPNRWGNTIGKPDPFWGYYLYKNSGDKTPEVEYSDNLVDSERFAKRLLKEKILGISMKYQVGCDTEATYQQKVSVIVLATEKKIYVFHLARHVGDTVDEIVAPSLRKVLEKSKIVKVGVAVLSVVFARLKDHLGIEALSAFELSHLHNLLNERGEANTQIVPLEHQIQSHTNLRLWVSHQTEAGDWCSAKLTADQEKYVATEAYAAFALFHCMDSKREAMVNPKPPLPLLADKYLSYGMSPVVGLQIGRMDGTTPSFTAELYFRAHAKGAQPKAVKPSVAIPPVVTPSVAKSAAAKPSAAKPVAKSSVAKPTVAPPVSIARAESQEKIFLRLRDVRTRQSTTDGVPPFIVANDAILREMAQVRPLSVAAMTAIHGLEAHKIQKYGTEWLEEIRRFCDEEEMATLKASQPASLTMTPSSDDSTMGQPAGAKRPRPTSFNTPSSSELAPVRQPLGLISTTQTNSAKRPRTIASDTIPKASIPQAPILQVSTPQASIPQASGSQAPSSQDSDLSPGTRVFRSKLIALTRRVEALTKREISPGLLKAIATRLPQSTLELMQIPGALALVDACREAQVHIHILFPQ